MADRHHERLNGIFNAMDADKSGEVTPLEFMDHMLGTQMEHETVSALFRKMDTDGNGSISPTAVRPMSVAGCWPVAGCGMRGENTGRPRASGTRPFSFLPDFLVTPGNGFRL